MIVIGSVKIYNFLFFLYYVDFWSRVYYKLADYRENGFEIECTAKIRSDLEIERFTLHRVWHKGKKGIADDDEIVYREATATWPSKANRSESRGERNEEGKFATRRETG